MNKNILVLMIAVFAILASSLVKCNRAKQTKEQIATQQSIQDSLVQVLDSLNLTIDSLSQIKPDTVVKTNTAYITRTVVDTVLKDYEPKMLSTSFIKDEVVLSFDIIVQNSSILDFNYIVDNMRNAQTNDTYIDTVHVVQNETIYDTVTVLLGQPIETNIELYKPRHFNAGFAVVADPTLSKLAPGLSLSYKQHELIGYYNVLDQAQTDRLGLMYRFNFWSNYRLQKIGENDNKKDN